MIRRKPCSEMARASELGDSREVPRNCSGNIGRYQWLKYNNNKKNNSTIIILIIVIVIVIIIIVVVVVVVVQIVNLEELFATSIKLLYWS